MTVDMRVAHSAGVKRRDLVVVQVRDDECLRGEAPRHDGHRGALDPELIHAHHVVRSIIAQPWPRSMRVLQAA